jgi:hypothetical protein
VEAVAKNRNHYFKVKPGDEERMLRGVDVQAVGLLFRLRLVTFDCDPCGFAVDHKRQPLDLVKLADAFSMTNGRFRAIFAELLERQLVQTAAAYREAMLTAPGGWVKLKINALHELLRAFAAPLDEIFVVPTLVDDNLDVIVGQQTQKQRGKASMPPIEAPHARGAYMGGQHAQISEVRDQNQRLDSEPTGKKKEAATTARASDGEVTGGEFLSAQDGRAPWSWQRHLYLCDQVRKWRAKLPAEVFEDAQREGSYFFAEFGFDVALFRHAQEIYAHGPADPPVPQACVDGLHAAGNDGRCANCGTRTAEEIA